MITIVDYGVGNIQAFASLYQRLYIPVKIAQEKSELEGATKLILPGVGSFDHAMDLFNASGMREEVEFLVMSKKIPVLGICVGMQMLAKASDEGVRPGLGWIDGKVRAFSDIVDLDELPLPHMGWNNVSCELTNPLFKGMGDVPIFYFLHSYYFECVDVQNSIGKANYSFDYCCAVSRENIYGVQFHPEKSHSCGEILLKNFAEL